MNQDQVSGKVDQVAGKVKQKVGETFGNQDLANRGLADQATGAAKETWGNVKEAANENTNDTRDRISQSVENVKNRLNEKIDAAKEEDRRNEVANRTA